MSLPSREKVGIADQRPPIFVANEFWQQMPDHNAQHLISTAIGPFMQRLRRCSLPSLAFPCLPFPSLTTHVLMEESVAYPHCAASDTRTAAGGGVVLLEADSISPT